MRRKKNDDDIKLDSGRPSNPKSTAAAPVTTTIPTTTTHNPAIFPESPDELGKEAIMMILI